MADKIILAGEPEELRTAITTIMAVHQMLQGLELDGGQNYRELHPRRARKPIVTLEFREAPTVTNKERLKEGEISFRLMNKTSNTITKADLKTLAELIKSKFATPPFVWQKGKNLYSYVDWEKGYQLQILAPNTQVAKSLIDQVLEVQRHSPDWENLNSTVADNPLSKYPELGEKEVVLGESVRLPARRPNVAVKFRRATLHLSGLSRPVVLLDLSGKASDPVIEA